MAKDSEHRRKTPFWKSPLFIAGVLVFILVAAVYSLTLNVPFYLDDKTEILENPVFHYPGDIGELFRYKHSRFLGHLTLALNWKFGERSTTGYHVVNLLIHITAAEAVLALLYMVGQCHGWGKRESVFLACFGALIFGVHPLQTGAVTYIVQRLESQQGMCVILSVTLYMAARLRSQDGQLVSPPWLFASIFFALGAIFTKQPSFTLPLMIGAVEYLVIQYKKPDRKAAWLLCPYVAISILLIALVVADGSMPSAHSAATIQKNAMGGLTDSRYYRYGLTQLKAHLFYMRMVFLPYGQSLDHYFPTIRTIRNPWALGGAVTLLWMFTMAVLLRKRSPLISLAFLWYLLSLAVSSSIIPILDHVFEHRLYTAIVGYSLLLILLVRLIPPTKLRYIVCGILVISYGWLAFARNELWRDPVAFWADAARKAPQKARPFAHMAEAQWKLKQFRNAEKNYLKAIDVKQTKSSIQQRAIWANNLGAMYRQTGDTGKAERSFRFSIKVRPVYATAYYNLGALKLTMAGKTRDKKLYAEGLSYLKRATELRKDYSQAYYYLGLALRNRPAQSAMYLQKAIATDKDGKWAAKAKKALNKN